MMCQVERTYLFVTSKHRARLTGDAHKLLQRSPKHELPMKSRQGRALHDRFLHNTIQVVSFFWDAGNITPSSLRF